MTETAPPPLLDVRDLSVAFGATRVITHGLAPDEATVRTRLGALPACAIAT